MKKLRIIAATFIVFISITVVGNCSKNQAIDDIFSDNYSKNLNLEEQFLIEQISDTHVFFQKPYRRKNIEKQCDNYRKIFDPLYKSIIIKGPNKSLRSIFNEISDTHAPNLISLYEDGILIVRDFIINNDLDKKYISTLEELFKIAHEMDDQRLFTPQFSSIMNYSLAFLVGHIKAEPLKGFYSHSLEEIFQILHKKNFERQILKKLDPFLCDIVYPVFTLYAHPDKDVKKRGISINTFIKQFSAYDYPSTLAIIDIYSERNENKKRTKKDAHYSSISGTFHEFCHDIQHAYYISRFANSKIFFLGLKEAFELYLEILVKGKSHEASIIHNMHFLVHHELPVFADLSSSEDINQKGLSNFQIRANLMEKAFLRLLNERKTNFPTQEVIYKEAGRDFEFIFNSLNQQGNPFLEKICIIEDKKYRPYPIAQQRDESYTIVHQQEDFDSDNMKWILSHKCLPEEILKERNQLLCDALIKACKEYWFTFNCILNKNIYNKKI